MLLQQLNSWLIIFHGWLDKLSEDKTTGIQPDTAFLSRIIASAPLLHLNQQKEYIHSFNG
jgi:hypothetical protein